MDKIRQVISVLTSWFHKLPSPIQIIYFIMSSAILTQLIQDLTNLQIQNAYLKIFVYALINILQYEILQLGQYKTTTQLDDSTIVVSTPAKTVDAAEQTAKISSSLQ